MYHCLIGNSSLQFLSQRTEESVFYLEEGGGRFLQNRIPIYTAQHCTHHNTTEYCKGQRLRRACAQEHVQYSSKSVIQSQYNGGSVQMKQGEGVNMENSTIPEHNM
jgi:hypothetical protein